jgi:hypothetical protein
VRIFIADAMVRRIRRQEVCGSGRSGVRDTHQTACYLALPVQWADAGSNRNDDEDGIEP